MLFLDVDHRVIVFEEMYQGTINGTHVYPREVAKAALQYNAAAVILVHNHPGVSAEPREADRVVTTKLVHALFLIGVEVLEHIVIGSGKPGSGARCMLSTRDRIHLETLAGVSRVSVLVPRDSVRLR